MIVLSVVVVVPVLLPVIPLGVGTFWISKKGRIPRDISNRVRPARSHLVLIFRISGVGQLVSGFSVNSNLEGGFHSERIETRIGKVGEIQKSRTNCKRNQEGHPHFS